MDCIEKMFPSGGYLGFLCHFAGQLYSPLVGKGIPDFIGNRSPLFGSGDAAVAVVAGTLRALQVGGMGTGFLHHLGQTAGVIQHGAWAQHVFVEGLAAAVLGLIPARLTSAATVILSKGSSSSIAWTVVMMSFFVYNAIVRPPCIPKPGPISTEAA